VIFGSRWAPDEAFGLLPMIAGTVAVALPAALLGGLFALATALWIDGAGRRGRPAAKFYALLSAIPTVVYGFVAACRCSARR